MLLPLLLEAGDYGAFDDKLNEIAWEEEEEKASFESYYGILKSLSEEGRQLWQLDGDELEAIQTIAEEGYEHSVFAKALLEFAYGREWHHYQEQLPLEVNSYKLPTVAVKSTLHDAVPNPSGGSTRIEVSVSKEDAANANLIVRNLLGQIVYQQRLTGGNQTVELGLNKLSSGIYTYSLNAAGRTLKTKRLVVNH